MLRSNAPGAAMPSLAATRVATFGQRSIDEQVATMTRSMSAAVRPGVGERLARRRRWPCRRPSRRRRSGARRCRPGPGSTRRWCRRCSARSSLVRTRDGLVVARRCETDVCGCRSRAVSSCAMRAGDGLAGGDRVVVVGEPLGEHARGVGGRRRSAPWRVTTCPIDLAGLDGGALGEASAAAGTCRRRRRRRPGSAWSARGWARCRAGRSGRGRRAGRPGCSG